MINSLLLRSTFTGCLIALVFTGCAGLSDKPAENKDSRKGTGPGGPGDDNDRPVTVIGSSLLFSWFDSVTIPGSAWTAISQERRRYKDTDQSALGAAARKVSTVVYQYDAQDTDPVTVEFNRIAGQKLTVTVYYQAGGSGSPVTRELAFDTAADGTNLEYFQPGSATTPALRKLGKRLRRHPSRKGRVIKVEFQNVSTSSDLTGSFCSVAAATYTCVVNNAANNDRNSSTIEFSVMP